MNSFERQGVEVENEYAISFKNNLILNQLFRKLYNFVSFKIVI